MLDNLFQLTESTLSIGSFSLTFSVGAVIEIIIFAIVSYYIILWIKRTKAWNLLKGAAVLLLTYLLAKLIGLNNIAFLFEKLVSSLVLAVIIILQPEIRSVLEKIGTRSIIKGILPISKSGNEAGLTDEAVEEIVRAMISLGRNHTGALVVIERTILLNDYIDTGILLDANITSELLEQIFEHNTPLHDGAVIIRNGRIVSATCYLPLSKNTDISKELGTRHRAGLGISEVSDAIVLIASEETGALSIAVDGVLQRYVMPEKIREALSGAKGETETQKEKKIRKKVRSKV